MKLVRTLLVALAGLFVAGLVFADGMPVAQQDTFFRAVSRDDVAGARGFLDSGAATINDRNDLGKTGLMIAIERSNLQMVLALMTYRPDLQVQDNQGKTSLDYAAASGNLAIQNAVK